MHTSGADESNALLLQLMVRTVWGERYAGMAFSAPPL